MKFILMSFLFALPLFSNAQNVENFGKTEQQIISQLASDSECTFLKKEYVNGGSISVLWYYFESNNLNCKKCYFFDNNNKMIKYGEVYPPDKLNDLLLFVSNTDIFTKINDVQYYNNITKVVVEIQMGTDYCAITYRQLKQKPNSKKH